MTMTPEDLRNAKAESRLRDRDLAGDLGVSEAQIVAAHVGQWATRIVADPDLVMPQVPKLGEVMSLTRNDSAVHERVGTFGEYRSGPHAAMVLGKEIDTRIFPSHWQTGFAIEQDTDSGPRRSLQFFDAAGDAIQKIFLRDTSNVDAWSAVVSTLRSEDQSQTLTVAARPGVEPAKQRTDTVGALLEEWARMTDTHQFNRLTSKLGFNRLGAYRAALDTKWVTPLYPDAVETMLEAVSRTGQKVILFVGNRGNIQIHWGQMETIKPMGPWLNVLDPRFNLHLRGDHVAEVYRIEKPTKRGPAVSLEAFDDRGALIFQVFGQKDNDDDDNSTWHALLAELPKLEKVDA